ncbi:hypothetical protein [Haloferula sp.]|uniref:hypothetical protein n=1 Tax=Haloferula sp. TaxID=2497595 RepID=UPI00329DF445
MPVSLAWGDDRALFPAFCSGEVMRFLLLILLLGVHAEARVWKDAYQREFEAELVSRRGNELVMAMPGGRQFTMKVEALSPADQRIALSSSPTSGNRASTNSNIGATWPSEVRNDSAAAVRMAKEDRDAGQFVYETPHYRFRCNVRLSQDVLRHFSVMFETTYRYCTRLPLSMKKSGASGGRFEVLLFETMGQYVQAGGSPGSAGCFVSGRDLVMTPLSSLGVTPYAGGYRLDRSQLNTVLIHEIVHQLTPASYFRTGARGWFSEGLAEYVASSPYSWGYFRVDAHGSSVKAYVTGHGLKGKAGRGLGTQLPLPSLRSFMNQPYQSFTGGAANRNYGFSLMLVHYFFHMDGQGKGRRISAYLKALNSGQDGATAHKYLLGSRSFEQLEQDIAKAWKAKGVTLRFGS